MLRCQTLLSKSCRRLSYKAFGDDPTQIAGCISDEEKKRLDGLTAEDVVDVAWVESVGGRKAAAHAAKGMGRGVSWNHRLSKYISGIRINGKRIHLGCFTDAVEAARAYDKAAWEHLGRYILQLWDLFVHET
jgi:hypothetical protein